MNEKGIFTIDCCDTFGNLFELSGDPNKFDQIFTKEELRFLGVPDALLKKCMKKPMVIKLQMELVCD